MPAFLPSSCDENVTDPDLADPDISGAQNVTLAFPGCPSRSAEICICFEHVNDLSCQQSSSYWAISEKNLHGVFSETANDVKASELTEKNRVIASNDCLNNASDVGSPGEVTDVRVLDKGHQKGRNLIHTVPMFARCSSQVAGSAPEIGRERKLATSPRRLHAHFSPNRSSSLNWVCDRKKVLEGGRDDNTPRFVSLKAKCRGRAHKCKSDGHTWEEYGSSNAGVTTSSPVLSPEICYSSPPRETLCGHQGDTRVDQISHNTGVDDKHQKLTNEDKCQEQFGSTDLDVPTAPDQEQTTDSQETVSLTSAASNPHRSPPHSRAKGKDHRLIDSMFLDVLKLLVAADNCDADFLIKPGIEGEIQCPQTQKNLADLNQTANHDQWETVPGSASHTDCSTSRPCSTIHNLSEDDGRGSSSKGNNSELNMSQSWKYDVGDDDNNDDRYECLCCKAKKVYCSQDNNNCHYVSEEDNNEECSEHWDCLDSAPSSGGSSRESLRSNEDANVNLQRRSSSDDRTGKRPSVRELVRSLQERFSACTNPRPSVKQPMDILPEWQFTCCNAATTTSISRAASSSHQDDLSGIHSPLTSSTMSLRDADCSRDFSAGRLEVNVTKSAEHEKSDHNNKMYLLKPPELPSLRRKFNVTTTVRNHKEEGKIPTENHERFSADVSLTGETFDEDGDENKTYCQVKQFLQHTDQSVVVSRTGMTVPRGPVFDNSPVSLQDTTGGSYLHGRLFLSTPDDKSTDCNTPEVSQLLRISQDHPSYEQITEDRQACFQQANLGMSSGTSEKILREHRWSSLLGANSCLGKMKATLSKVRSKSVGPLMTKLSSMFGKMKDVRVHANTSLSLSGILEENSQEHTHPTAATKQASEGSCPCPVETLGHHGRLLSIDSQTTDEPGVHSPVHTASSVSGDDHPPIFCLAISRTASVRKTGKQQPRHQSCTVTRDSMHQSYKSTGSSQFVERNELTKIQQSVLHKNVEALHEFVNDSPGHHQAISAQCCRPNGNIALDGSCLKYENCHDPSHFREMQMPISPSWGPSISTLMAEAIDACEAPHWQDTPVESPHPNTMNLDMDVESISVQELIGILDTPDKSPGDPNPCLRPFASPINDNKELLDTPPPGSVFSSPPEKSYSWLNVTETAHTEPCITEVMAIVSEETHMKRYPSFPDLTNLSSDMASVMSATPSDVVDHSFVKAEVHYDAEAQRDASGTLKLPAESPACVFEPSIISVTDNDSSNLADNNDGLNGCQVKAAEESTLENCPELCSPQKAMNELTTNSQAETDYVVPTILTENITDANSALVEASKGYPPLAGLGGGCGMFNFPKIYTDLTPLASSIDKEPIVADNVLKGTYLLSPHCDSVSEYSWANEAFGSQTDQSVNGPKINIILTPNVLSADLPSPPDHSLSDNSWDNDDSDTHTDRSEKDLETSAPDNVAFQSTSDHMDMMFASSARDKRLQLLRAAVTQDLGPASFGASSDSCSSEERQLLDERHSKPTVFSPKEDSQSSEMSMSSLSCTDNLKETQESDYLHLYVVDVFRDFRTDLDQSSVDEISDVAVKDNLSSPRGTLAVEPNDTSESHEDCQLDIPNPTAAVVDPGASEEVVNLVGHSVMAETGNDVVEDLRKDVSVNTPLLAVSGAARKHAEDGSETSSSDSDCGQSQDCLPHDDDNLFSKTQPKIIEKVLKSHSQLPSSCTEPPGAASDGDDPVFSGAAGEKSLNKPAKRIRWLDTVTCTGVVPTDSGHSNTVYDSSWTGQCSSMDRDNTVPQKAKAAQNAKAPQKDTAIDMLDTNNMCSRGIAKEQAPSMD